MRSLLIATLLGAWALGASAQTDVTPGSEAQRLACLVKPADPPRYPQHDNLDRGEGAMRVLLKFTKPDAKPTVEVLFNSAREDMQDRVHDYVARYRLPCLQPDDGEVTAVQEFSFRNNDRDPQPLPTTAPDQPPLCIVMPRHALDYKLGISKPEPEHAVAEITFKGDGRQPPDVKFTYSTSPRLEESVREWVAEYRMPCRTAQDKPRTIEQRFSMFPDNRRRYGFKRERFSLPQFLALTREPWKQTAYFDLNTMACPFRVDFVIGGDNFPHRATVRDRPDPNKLGFLRWLESLQFDFKSASMARDLFGTLLQIDVGCGVVDFKGEVATDAR